MSLDRSLKTGSGLSRHRNVLSRAERIGRLTEKGKFDITSSSPLNLPKVGNRKAAVAKAAKKDAAAEGTPAAGGAAPAAGKAAAPAAKAAAPAAKAKK